MNDLFHEINYSGKVVSDSFILPDEPKTQKIFPLDLKKDISKELGIFLATKLLALYNGYLFYTPPRYETAIHIDGLTLHKRPALNFVLGQEKLGLMNWYRLKDGVEVPLPTITPHNTLYLQTEKEKTVKITEHALTGLCLVNTGIFHNVVNQTDKGRWCVSIRFDQKLSFSEVLDKFLLGEVF